MIKTNKDEIINSLFIFKSVNTHYNTLNKMLLKTLQLI